MQSKETLGYAERERHLSPGARKLMDATWASLAKRFMPDMPEAEAVAAFKELHAFGLIELVRVRGGVELRMIERAPTPSAS